MVQSVWTDPRTKATHFVKTLDIIIQSETVLYQHGLKGVEKAITPEHVCKRKQGQRASFLETKVNDIWVGPTAGQWSPPEHQQVQTLQLD